MRFSIFNRPQTLRVILIFGFLSIAGYGMAQKFGKPVIEELEMKNYEPDPLAEAVVLSDVGRAYFESWSEGIMIRYTRTVRIKILSNAGLDWGEVELPYYQDGYGKSEIITDIKGFTYNLSETGDVITSKLDRKQIFNVKNNNSWSAKKFVLPDVKPGSVEGILAPVSSKCFHSPYAHKKTITHINKYTQM